MASIGLFITYEEIGDRIVKGVGITYEVVNYTSPTHIWETSEILTPLIYPLRITEPEKDKYSIKI